ncbi:MAG: metal-dependent hydrolase [Candidatus Woesearchaeota archaeon]
MKKASYYRTHLFYSIFAYIVSLIIIHFLNIQTNYIILAFVCLVYSLIPDIDTHKSVIWKIFTAIIILFLFFYKSYFFVILLLIAIFLALFIKHRGFTHTYLSAIILSLPLFYFGLDLFIVGLLSYVSHLLVDNKIKFM